MTPTAPDQAPGRYGYAVMSVQWAMNIVVPAVGFSLGILLPQMTEDLGLTPVQAGLLGSSVFLGSLATALISSVVLSRYSPKRVTAIVTLLAAAFVALQGWAPSFSVLLATRFLFVVSMASRIQAEVLLIQQWFPRKRIALINSISAGAVSTGQAAGMFVTPFLLLALGTWRNLYYATGGLFLALLAVWMVVGRERAAPAQPTEGRLAEESPLRVLARHKRLWLLGAGPAGAALTFSAFMTFWPTFAIETHSLPLTTVGSMVALFPFAGIAVNLAAGPLSDLIRRRKPLIWVPGLILPPAYIGLLSVGSVPGLTALMLLTGVCAWIWVSVIRTVPFDMGLAPREIAVTTGLTGTLIPVGGASGPLIVGALLQLTGSLHTAMLAVVFFPMTLLLALLLPETSPFRPVPPEGEPSR